jgi:hypothetical protein
MLKHNDGADEDAYNRDRLDGVHVFNTFQIFIGAAYRNNQIRIQRINIVAYADQNGVKCREEQTETTAYEQEDINIAEHKIRSRRALHASQKEKN